MADEKKVAVKFTENYTVQDHRVGTDEEESYQKGKRVMLAAASANHFVSRGKAVLAGPAKKKAAAKQGAK